MVKILRILVAAPFIGVGFIPLLFGALMMLIAYRCMTIFRPKTEDEGVDLMGLMKKFQGGEDEDRQE